MEINAGLWLCRREVFDFSTFRDLVTFDSVSILATSSTFALAGIRFAWLDGMLSISETISNFSPFESLSNRILLYSYPSASFSFFIPQHPSFSNPSLTVISIHILSIFLYSHLSQHPPQFSSLRILLHSHPYFIFVLFFGDISRYHCLNSLLVSRSVFCRAAQITWSPPLLSASRHVPLSIMYPTSRIHMYYRYAL